MWYDFVQNVGTDRMVNVVADFKDQPVEQFTTPISLCNPLCVGARLIQRASYSDVYVRSAFLALGRATRWTNQYQSGNHTAAAPLDLQLHRGTPPSSRIQTNLSGLNSKRFPATYTVRS